LHTVKDLKIAITDNQSQLYGYAKRFIHLFGEVEHIDKQKNPDIVICCCGESDANDIEKSRSLYPNVAKLYLFEEQSIVESLELSDNEDAIALPFYASKINDSIAQLIFEKSKESIKVQDISFEGRVLVAEDNSANQELIGYMLESMGVEFDIASNGEQAYDAFKTKKYDVVLMDINMPVVDGLEALKMIREHEDKNNMQKTPVIALTANAIKGDKEKFLNAGMDGYLTKPIDTQSLKATLQKYLTQKSKVTLKDETKENSEPKEQKIQISSETVAKRLGVSKKIAQMLIVKFQTSITKDLDEFHSIIKSGNKEQITQKAHYIKNSCLNMGLDEVCAILEEIETNDLTKESLNEAFKKIKSLLQSYI